MNERISPRPAKRSQPRVIPAQQLFGPYREVRIEFRGEHYSLRVTKNDKLILTK
ncbi:MAG: hemin uptake protein HemP [Pseudomonadota bacterium]